MRGAGPAQGRRGSFPSGTGAPSPHGESWGRGIGVGDGRGGALGEKIAVRKRRGIVVFSPVPFNGSVREINGNSMEGMENYK